MPVTQFEFPILQFFFCRVEKETGMPVQPVITTPEQQAQLEDGSKPLPKGVVLGPDGKPYVGIRGVKLYEYGSLR